MATMAERMLQARESWCTLRPAEDGRPALKVKLRRPAESAMRAMAGVGVSDADVCAAAVDWEGFSEAELLGAAVGSADPIPFDGQAWQVYVLDSVASLSLCQAHLVQAISTHLDQVVGDRKN